MNYISEKSFTSSGEKTSESKEKLVDNKVQKPFIENEVHVKAERYICPPELIFLHCPKCNDSFKKPPRKKISSCERCSTAYLLQCSKCRKIFRKYITLYCHVKAICGNPNLTEVKPKDGRICCSECGTKFSTYENLKRHKRLTCRQQAAYKCSNCPFVSKYKASLELHDRTHHRDNQYVYRCGWCDKSFRHSQTLKRHENYNCGKEKSFSCGHCDYKCYLKYQLKTHLRTKHQKLFCCKPN